MADKTLSFRHRLLRSALIAILVVALLVLGSMKIAQIYLRTAEESYTGKMPLGFGEYVPAPLPEGAINAVDYLEATTVLIDGHSLIEAGGSHQRAAIDAGLTAIAERLRQLEPTPAAAPTTADLELFREAVRRLDLPLEIYDRGVERSTHARTTADYGVVPMKIQIPNLMAYLRIGHLVRARAVVAAAEGRTADAWRDAASLYRMADWVRQSMPTLIHALVARSLALQGGWLVQHLLSAAPTDATTLARVLEEARRVDPQAHFERIHGAERAAVYSTMLDRRTPASEGMGLPTWGPWLELNAGAYLRWAGPSFERCDRPYRETLQRKASVKDELPAWATAAKMLAFDCAVSSSPKRDLWRVAIDQLAIALELEKARERTGAYPEGLMTADASIPPLRDPFSGEPYLYRREGAGYVLYSVGMNGVDDGGKPGLNDQGAPDATQGDAVWAVKPWAAPATAPPADPAQPNGPPA
jgi:hypothetical protein